MAKLKTELESTTIVTAIEDAKMELSDLSSEMGEWRDNMSGTGLENTEKYQAVEEVADMLENLESQLDSIDMPEENDAEIEVYWSHPYGHHIGRSWRASHIASLLNAVVQALPDEHDAVSELEDIANEIEEIDFPTMFG